MLRLLARDAEAFGRIAPRLTDEHFRTPVTGSCSTLLRRADGDARASSDAEGGDEERVQALTALALEPLDGDPHPGVRGGGLGAAPGVPAASAAATRSVGELQKLNPMTDPGYDELFQQLIAVDGELRRLRERRTRRGVGRTADARVPTERVTGVHVSYTSRRFPPGAYGSESR